MAFVETFISGHTDVDFCPCCVKFIRHDAEGWEVVGPDAYLGDRRLHDVGRWCNLYHFGLTGCVKAV